MDFNSGLGGFSMPSSPTSVRGMPMNDYMAKQLRGTEFIQQGFQPAYQDIMQGSKGAGELLRQGYQDQFNARAGGIVSGLGESQNRLMAGAAGSGLSPDVIQRMLVNPQAQAQGQIGQARAETQGGMHADLAQLLKGTGTELANLNEQEQSMLLNWLQARGATHQAQKAGKMAMWAGLGEAAIGGASSFAHPGTPGGGGA